MNKHNNKHISYEVISQIDENGDLLIPLPPHILKDLEWKENDKIVINIDKNGNYVFTKDKS